MVDECPQTSKRSNGIGNRLKRYFRASSPHRRSGSPRFPALSSSREISRAVVSSAQLTIPVMGAGPHKGHCTSTPLSRSPSWSSVTHPSGHAAVGKVHKTATEPEALKPSVLSTTKDVFGVASSFMQMILKKVPDVVDINPVKIVFVITKIILQIKDDVQDNLSTVERRILTIAAQLLVVENALVDWKPSNTEETQAIILFESVLNKELTKLAQLKKQSLIIKIAIYEEEKRQIAEIFEGINQAREQLVLVTGLRVHKAVHAIQEGLAKSLLKDLKASGIADHKYYLEGEELRSLRRAVCTPRTRVRILADITRWANDTSSESETVYWLFGPAGSGKSTIAYTIARRFEFAGDADDMTILGGNFFCSRLFEDTRRATHIVRTIVYHLALRCKPFADALCHSGRFETTNHKVCDQLEGLLVGPWEESEAARLAEPSTPPYYLIVIDALDEIDGKGGSEFLRDLINTINRHHLQGLKFFATSRPDPDLTTHLESFQDKRYYRLEQVPIEEAQADIATYLNASLPDFAGRLELDRLVAQACGLFIYAATVVKHLADYEPVEQEEILTELSSSSDLAILKTSPDDTPLLDELYLRILLDSFRDLKQDIRARRLQILYTFLCTAERISTTVAIDLLFTSNKSNSAFSYTRIADCILRRLHAVLYTEQDKVLWYHKSFPDFLFDRNRSKDFWCNQAEHHRRLTNSCFRVMKAGLRFNIANIPSSLLLDRDNTLLQDEIRQHIPPTLTYSCRNWDHHLSAVAYSESEPLCDALTDFLQLRVLFWLEAMNLLGSRGLCDPMLQTARQWVMMRNSALTEDLTEAGSFAVYFSGSAASLSTPHLYISALATWAQRSNLCFRWRSHFPGIPCFTNALRSGEQLLTLRLETEVNAVAYSQDGRLFVSGSWDKLVRVWDTSTGEVLNVLKGHTHWVTSVAFSSDGRWIVSGSADKSVRIWEVSTGDVLNVLEGHTKEVSSVGFSSDTRRVVSGSSDDLVRVWDVSTGTVLSVLEGHTAKVTSVAFSNDGRHIVSGSADESIRVWDATRDEVLNILEGHTAKVTSVAYSNDGRRIASGSYDKSVRVWDALSGSLLNVLEGHTHLVTSVAFSSDGRRIVSGSYDQSVRMWDTLTGEPLNVLEGHSDWVMSVAFSSDGNRIVSGSYDQSVRAWGASTGESVNVLEGHTDWVMSAAISGDGNRIVSGSYDQSVRVWDTSTGKSVKVLEGHTDKVRSVAFSRNDRRIVSGSHDKSVRVWDALTGELVNVLRGHTDWIMSTAFSSDGKLIVSGSADKSVRVWDALTGKLLTVLEGHSDWVTSVAFSSDGSRIVSGSADKSVRVWDALTDDLLNVLEGHSDWLTSVAFSSDESRIISGSYDKSVRVWDGLTGELLNVFEGHTDRITSVAFSSDVRQVVSGSEDNLVRVWDTFTGEVLNVLEGHTDWVTSVAFSSSSSWIVSGSADKSVRVWDVSTAEFMRSNMVDGHTHSVTSVAFSNNGGQISSGTSDQVWEVSMWPPSCCYIREKIMEPTGHWTHTGWLLSPTGEGYLMFVPLDAQLSDSSNILTIPSSSTSSIDFASATLGLQWHNCYIP